MLQHDDRLLRYFGKHLVALGVTAITDKEMRKGDIPRFYAYPGTLIHIGGMICFLTAGHNIVQIKENIQSGATMRAKLVDTFGLKQKSTELIPFHLNPDRMFYVDDEKLGLDFGLVILSAYYQSLIAANETPVLQDINWMYQENVKFDRYAMCGLPSDLMPKRLADFDARTFKPVFFTVSAQESLPEKMVETTYERFIAHVEPREAALPSVKGMSGCPIFGFKRDGDQIRYWLVAIQSSWLPSHRIIFGCPISLIGSIINEWCETYKTKSMVSAVGLEPTTP